MSAPPTKLEELRACPFCGNRLRVRTNINPMGQCDTDGCWMHDRQIAVALDVPSQVAGWNTRATDAELASLRTRNGELERALEPFADFAERVAIERHGWNYDAFAFTNLPFDLTMAPFRRARALVEGAKDA